MDVWSGSWTIHFIALTRYLVAEDDGKDKPIDMNMDRQAVRGTYKADPVDHLIEFFFSVSPWQDRSGADIGLLSLRLSVFQGHSRMHHTEGNSMVQSPVRYPL